MSVETKFTPGPWQLAANGEDVLCANGVFVTSPFHRGATNEQARANARLMAAAPDLYAALCAMVDRWEPDTTGQDRVMWENARAALAKAGA